MGVRTLTADIKGKLAAGITPGAPPSPPPGQIQAIHLATTRHRLERALSLSQAAVDKLTLSYVVRRRGNRPAPAG